MNTKLDEQVLKESPQCIQRFKNIDTQLDTHKHETKNDISLLSARLKTSEDNIPPLKVRIQVLEDINHNCDFPNSLSTLVGQMLNQ
jgi:ferritin-like metal-binding protein YciE